MDKEFLIHLCGWVASIAHIYFHDDGWAAKGGGWKSNKHELLPFPYDVIVINPWNEETGEGLKQNPGWE